MIEPRIIFGTALILAFSVYGMYMMGSGLYKFFKNTYRQVKDREKST